jgi:hypothetical protein
MPAGMLDSMTKMYQMQLGTSVAMPAGMLDSITKMYQMQLGTLAAMPAGMLDSIAKATGLQLGAAVAMPRISASFLTNTYFSQISEALQVLENGEIYNSLAEVKQKLSNREFAAWLTIIAFLVIYISCSTAIGYYSYVVEISRTDGPTPFEAAMTVGAFVFWVRMNHSGGSSDK